MPKNDPAAQKAIGRLISKEPQHQIFHTEEMKISPCVGCNFCWLRTPGVCAIKDDYQQLLQAYLKYDVTVFITGTALGFVNYQMKNIVDRILPLATMYTTVVDGEMRHVPRYKRQYRFALLYSGEADDAYLNRWLHRVAINMNGLSLGAFPIEKEVSLCI